MNLVGSGGDGEGGDEGGGDGGVGGTPAGKQLIAINTSRNLDDVDLGSGGAKALI